MTFIRWTFTFVTWFLLISAASAQESRAPDPLFESNEILDVRIVAPMSTMIAERPIEEELTGVFQYTNSAGEDVAFDIQVRTRGRSRRDRSRCKVPPLRLNFRLSQTKGTLFHKQDKVKLVTHCQNSTTYREVLLREYIAYRILNVMTDTSFKVRLLRITYVDTDDKNRENLRYGFIIEHRDRLSKRISLPVLEIPSADPSTLNSEYSSTVAMYHYLLGNTDFSSAKGAKLNRCCHNHVLFGNDNKAVWSVPYDFDQAGLVNAPHAAPNPRFGLSNVKRRLYRGRCMHNEVVEATVAKYQDKRQEVFQVLNEVLAVSDRSIRPMTDYIGKFYKVLDSEKKLRKEIIEDCI